MTGPAQLPPASLDCYPSVALHCTGSEPCAPDTTADTIPGSHRQSTLPNVSVCPLRNAPHLSGSGLPSPTRSTVFFPPYHVRPADIDITYRYFSCEATHSPIASPLAGSLCGSVHEHIIIVLCQKPHAHHVGQYRRCEEEGRLVRNMCSLSASVTMDSYPLPTFLHLCLTMTEIPRAVLKQSACQPPLILPC